MPLKAAHRFAKNASLGTRDANLDLLGDLQRLGIEPGDVVMPHASLRRIGARAEAVIEALDRAAGTVLMNVGPCDDEPFDALRTPVDPNIGVLAEVFRTTPGTLVTNHPEGRFGARGALASELLANPPWNDYYGPGSPLERLAQLGGKVLRLGADLSSLTLLHYAEYVAPLATKRRVRREHAVVGPNGTEIKVIECLDDSDGIVDWPGEDYFDLIVRAYVGTGRAASGLFGSAESDLFDAADLVQFGAAWMGEHLVSGSK
jgi:aminoglycoside N3'-acetyltransferase